MKWLPDVDLNHDKQIQSLLCYRYTIGQDGMYRLNILKQSQETLIGGMVELLNRSADSTI